MLYSSNSPIGGFQFNVSGFNVLSGTASDAGFTVSNSGNTIVGFSFTGASLPAGDNLLLVTLDVEVTDTEGCLSDEIISNVSGLQISSSVGSCSDLPCNPDCADVCNGDSVEDCAGTCGGDAEVLACGCNDSTSCLDYSISLGSFDVDSHTSVSYTHLTLPTKA